jgi:hypothetical protein
MPQYRQPNPNPEVVAPPPPPRAPRPVPMEVDRSIRSAQVDYRNRFGSNRYGNGNRFNLNTNTTEPEYPPEDEVENYEEDPEENSPEDMNEYPEDQELADQINFQKVWDPRNPK